ncbi:MAG: TonB-dependent receptor [Aliiglaciecola sp.]
MLRSKQTILVSAISIALGLSQHAVAQTKPTQKDEQEVETLVVTANPLNRSVLESAAPVSIITGEDLQSRVAPTLGETLKNVPGVHSTYFGPVSSSPIIRGLDGPRIKVLQNGLDVSDASRIGPDHIVSTETSNARQIEVLRGPATLLYGSGAIGGVVNVVDNRLPVTPIDGFEGSASYLHDTVSSEDLFNVNVDGGSGNFVFHFDAFDRETDDYDIPGPAEIGSDEDTGVLENSFIDANGFNVGIGWATDSFNAALAFGNLESEYGIPGHAHGHEDEHEEEHEGEHEDEHEHDEEEEVVFGQLEQDRVQALLDWKNLDGFFSEVSVRGAYTDYSHNEVEDGEIGTTFSNESLETRLWAKHRKTNGWEGVLGLNYVNSDFEALGDEAFTPASETDSVAVFLLEEKRIDNVLYQFGARYEDTTISVDNSFFEHHDEHEEEHEGEHEEEHEEEAFFFDDQDFSAVSLSAGAVWTIDSAHTLSFNLAHSQRAPSASEIFSNGLHIATNTFELGAAFDIEEGEDPDEYEIVRNEQRIEKEVANNLDITLHLTNKHIEASFSVFYNKIDDYLFQQNTGFNFDGEHGHGAHEEEHEEEHEGEHMHESDEEGIPIFIFRQQDAELYGFEAEVDWHFNDNLRLETFADVTRAELSDGQNVPRIPPLRIGAELHWEKDNWHAEIGATYYAKQDNIAEFETVTEGYTLMNAAYSYYMDVADKELVIFVRGNNLTNREARVHASFIKDDAPLPGRSFVLGARMQF